MTDDPADLISRLFAEATAILEEAHGHAMAGQGHDLEGQAPATLGQALEGKAQQVEAIARAILVIAETTGSKDETALDVTDKGSIAC